jgi:hypothetical protein
MAEIRIIVGIDAEDIGVRNCLERWMEAVSADDLQAQDIVDFNNQLADLRKYNYVLYILFVKGTVSQTRYTVHLSYGLLNVRENRMVLRGRKAKPRDQLAGLCYDIAMEIDEKVFEKDRAGFLKEDLDRELRKRSTEDVPLSDI